MPTKLTKNVKVPKRRGEPKDTANPSPVPQPSQSFGSPVPDKFPVASGRVRSVMNPEVRAAIIAARRGQVYQSQSANQAQAGIRQANAMQRILDDQQRAMQAAGQSQRTDEFVRRSELLGQGAGLSPEAVMDAANPPVSIFGPQPGNGEPSDQVLAGAGMDREEYMARVAELKARNGRR